MKRFQVTNGHHTDIDGKQYRKGDIIESERDLDTEWAGRFKSVGETVKENPSIPAVLKDEDSTPGTITVSTAETQKPQAIPLVSRRRRDEPAKMETTLPRFVTKKGAAGTWNVINTSTNVTMNSRRLSKAEAEALVKSLTV